MNSRMHAPDSEQLAFEVGSSGADVERLRHLVRESAENRPGIYQVHGAHGELLYVGKSNRIRTRLLSYFRLPWPEQRQARLLREAAAVHWEYVPSEFEALLREVRLIRTHLPRYNIRSARPLDRWWVITISDGPAPRLRVQRASVAARTRGRSGAVIGPFANRRPLVEALRVLNDALGLRDCGDRIPLVLRDNRGLFDEQNEPALVRTPGCHRYETRRCAGPCVAACSEREYTQQLQRARAVLEGRDDSPQQQLIQEMTVASAAMSYERAGWLRDRLAALQSLESQLARVREALSRPNCVYAVRGLRNEHTLYLIRDGRVADSARVADNDAIERLRRLSHERTHGVPDSANANELDELFMVEQWFRTRPDECANTASTVDDALQRLAHEC